MNARFISRVLSSLLMAATFLVLGGCASRPPVYVPSDRSYQHIQYWHGYGNQRVGGGCFSTRYDTAIPFTVAVPCQSSTNDVATGQTSRSRYSLSQLKPKLSEMTKISQKHCSYSAAPEHRWPSYECQKVVDEIAFLEREITKEERATLAQCQYQERGGVQSRQCSETVVAPWRKK